MRDRRTGSARAGVATVLAVLAMVGVSLAQQNAGPREKAREKEKEKGRGRAVAAPAQPPKGLAGGVDPLAPDGQAKAGALGTYHLTLKITASDKATLSATYYPSKLGNNASAVMLVHEKDRSSKDFEERIDDLKGEGLAEYLQGQGHAVLMFDLRGMGANPRKAASPKDWQFMVNDLQSAYQFLVDRTNRGELNLAKLCVVGLGEGANLAAAWAYRPGGAVSNEGRTSDLCALVLISPMADGEGLLLGHVLASLAPRVPLLLMVGERDQVSGDPVRAVRPVVERPQFKQNKVEVFDSSFHGYKLLRLEPKLTSILSRFIEGAAKYKAVEWEPRYNLEPITFHFESIVRNTKGAGANANAAADAAKEKAKEAPAPAAKEKAKEAPAPAAKEKAKEDVKK